MSKFLLTFLVLFLTFSAGSQAAEGNGPGKITGRITDKKTGEELIGVSVQVEGTSAGAVTSFDGSFSISGVAPGTHNIVVSYVSYTKKILKGIEVKPGEVTTTNIILEESTKELNEVVITAEYKKETASALLIQQKKSASISDGISADLIKKSPDATTGDVMKRISGTAIQDNRFAIIRGLNDRYNTAYINGAPLPSTESDRKAFSFDIFPSNMLDNMVITKTASPDLPGDFAGGVIMINTKDIPEKSFVSASVGASMHSNTTFKQSYENSPGTTNFFGVDNGTRELPTGIPARLQYEQSTSAEKLANSSKFNDNWKLDPIASTPVNNSFQVSGGSNFKVGKKQQVGFILSLSRSSSSRTTPVERNKFQKSMDVEENQFQRQHNDTVYKQEKLTGMMANFGWKLGGNHKISLKNSYTINTEDQTITRSGHDDLLETTGNPIIKNRYFMYQDNRLMSNQLIGEHFIPAAKLKVKWVLNNNSISRRTPDFKRVTTLATVKQGSEYYAYQVQIASGIDITQTGRFYSDLKEDIQSGGLDLQRPIEFLSGKKVKTEVKVGVFTQARARNFQVRSFGYKFNAKRGEYSRQRFTVQSPDSIFNDGNFAQDTFYIDEKINPQDVYEASSRLNSAYFMLDQRLFNRFRFVYGVRMENYNQKMSGFGTAGEPVKVDTTYMDFLPSANFTYELTDKINLRLSASKTLARPEFRELSTFSFYDFNVNSLVTGKPTLNRTQIQNYDFRFEFFPGESQLLSFSLFYKKFENAIEQIYEFSGSENLGYTSDAKARNYGFEVELRKNFDFLDKMAGTTWMKKFSVSMNYAYIQSKVTLDEQVSLAKFGSRPLQGQSPYIINAGLQFYDQKSTFSAAVLVNRVGRRIIYAREKNGLIPDLWENPRTVVDITFSKTFYKHFEVKFGISDLLAQDLIFYQDNNNNGRYDDVSTNINPANGPTPRIDPSIPANEKAKFDNPLFKYKMGYVINMGVGVKF